MHAIFNFLYVLLVQFPDVEELDDPFLNQSKMRLKIVP